MNASATAFLRRPSLWLGLLFSVGSLLLLRSVVNLPDLVDKVRSADQRFIVLGILTICAAPFLRALRWQTVLRAGTSFWAIFHAENMGYLLNNVLPLRLGEPARAVMLSRSTGTPTVEALSTVVLARLADMIAVLALLGLALAQLEVSDSVRLAGYGTLLLALTLLAALGVGAFAPDLLLRLLGGFVRLTIGRVLPASLTARLLGWAADFLNGLRALRQGRRLLELSLTTGVLWLCYLLYYQLILLAFAPGAPLAWSTLATSTASLSTALPSSPAYVGVYHAVVAFTLSPYIGQDAALGYAIVLHAVEFIIVLLFGFISLTVSRTSFGTVRRLTESLSEGAPK